MASDPGLQFDTWGLGLDHMDEGEPEHCNCDHGEIVVTFGGVEINRLSCPRGCE